jgi:hypothetical protein
MTPRLAPLLLSLSVALPVKAAPCAGLGDLLAFIAAETAYPVPATCPPVERSAALASAPALRSQVGAYVPATGRILLAPELDTTSPLGRSYLLHELVHAAQFRAGAHLRVRCEAELEAEAYRVQTGWLRIQGEFREAMLLDWAADALGRCGGESPRLDY